MESSFVSVFISDFHLVNRLLWMMVLFLGMLLRGSFVPFYFLPWKGHLPFLFHFTACLGKGHLLFRSHFIAFLEKGICFFFFHFTADLEKAFAFFVFILSAM